MVRYDPAIYNGAAVHYRYGRPAYSPGLEALLAEELGLDGRGPFLGLARRYQSDPCPEMTESGSRVSLPPYPAVPVRHLFTPPDGVTSVLYVGQGTSTPAVPIYSRYVPRSRRLPG
jgi:hypothetical protein